MEDDTEEATVGVKDGSVQAQVWLEKDYKANSATISSTQHIVFIGNSKLLKEQRSHIFCRNDNKHNCFYFKVTNKLV